MATNIEIGWITLIMSCEFMISIILISFHSNETSKDFLVWIWPLTSFWPLKSLFWIQGWLSDPSDLHKRDEIKINFSLFSVSGCIQVRFFEIYASQECIHEVEGTPVLSVRHPHVGKILKDSWNRTISVALLDLTHLVQSAPTIACWKAAWNASG